MAREDNMILYKKKESAKKVARVKEAVDVMIMEGYKITGYSVAKYAAVSKSFVYNNKEARQYIESNSRLN